LGGLAARAATYIKYLLQRTIFVTDESPFLGVVDIGSNTVSLSIYDTSDPTKTPQQQRVGHAIRITCKLIEGLDNGGGAIEEDKKELALAAAEFFAHILNDTAPELIAKAMIGDQDASKFIKQFGIEGKDRVDLNAVVHEIRRQNKLRKLENGKITAVYVAGTEALRRVEGTRAGNSFINQLGRILGHPVKVLSDEWEARFQGRAILSSKYCPPKNELHVFGALGGGSIQFGILDPKHDDVRSPISIRRGNLTVKSSKEIKSFLEEGTADLLKNLDDEKIDTFQILGSEWRWVARILAHRLDKTSTIEEVKIHRFKRTWEEVAEELLKLSKEPVSYFKQEFMPGEIHKRASHLALSARMLYETLSTLKPETIIIPEASLRDGIAEKSREPSFAASWKNKRNYAQPAQ
jgi:exopolyphosphatase/pppGpp-phosphohydrolase